MPEGGSWYLRSASLACRQSCCCLFRLLMLKSVIECLCTLLTYLVAGLYCKFSLCCCDTAS